MKELKLPVLSIPISSWGISLANLLPKEDWDKIRKKVLKAADYRCEICGRNDLPLHCHEVWVFHYSEQRLTKFLCLCRLCHDAVHYFGTTQRYQKRPSYIQEVGGHLMEINKITEKELDTYLRQVQAQNVRRAKKTYKVVVGHWVLAFR